MTLSFPSIAAQISYDITIVYEWMRFPLGFGACKVAHTNVRPPGKGFPALTAAGVTVWRNETGSTGSIEGTINTQSVRSITDRTFIVNSIHVGKSKKKIVYMLFQSKNSCAQPWVK